MAESHISLLEPFFYGDINKYKDWFQWFEIYTWANGWEAAMKATRLPTLL